MRRTFLTAFVLIIVFGGGFSAGWLLNQEGKTQAALPVLGYAPSYKLTNQLGQKVSSKSFDGKIRVVTFLFPYCTEYCPLIAVNLVSLWHSLKAAGLANEVQFVAFDVDPGHTGPKQMRAFLKEFGWHPSNMHWQYLTGKPVQIRRVVTGTYHIEYQRVTLAEEARQNRKAKAEGYYVPQPTVRNPLAKKAKVNYDVVHNDALAVVDQRGRIRKIYDDASRLPNNQLMTLIKRLLPH